jgi:hypothetical protein
MSMPVHDFPYMYITPCKLERFIGIITLANHWFKQIYSFSYIQKHYLFSQQLYLLYSYRLAKLALHGLQS